MDQPASRRMTPLDKQFSDCKEEIRQIYCDQGKPLRETMNFFTHRRDLKASMRKWKAKLKDWGFEKYSKSEDMAFITSKLQSRKAEGKDTAFYVSGRQITEETMNNFINRKKRVAENIASPTAKTPTNINYCTPEPEESDLRKMIKQIEMEIGEESEAEDILRKFREELVENFIKRKKLDTEKIESPTTKIGNTSYFIHKPEASEVEEVIKKIAGEMKEETWEAIQRKEKLKWVKGHLEKLETQDFGIFVPIQAREFSTMPVLLKVGDKTKLMDASQEDEPDQETMDMLAKINNPSWKGFRRRILFMTRCSQESTKPPLFPEQSSTTVPSGEALHPPEATRGGFYQKECSASYTEKSTTKHVHSEAGERLYVWSDSQENEDSEESFVDPLHQNDGATDAPKPKDHHFFRFPLGKGGVFQVIPESEAQLVPQEDVSHFVGLPDRDLDVAKQVKSAVAILELTRTEQDHMQIDHPTRLDDLARNLELIGRGDETGEQGAGDRGEEDQEMEDVSEELSSNPIGVTYTDSGMTGISWNYSALFP